MPDEEPSESDLSAYLSDKWTNVLRDGRDMIALLVGAIVASILWAGYAIPLYSNLVTLTGGIVLAGLFAVRASQASRERKRIACAEKKLREEWEVDLHAKTDNVVGVIRSASWHEPSGLTRVDVILCTPSPKKRVILSNNHDINGDRTVIRARLQIDSLGVFILTVQSKARMVEIPPCGELELTFLRDEPNEKIPGTALMLSCGLSIESDRSLPILRGHIVLDRKTPNAT